MKIDSSNLMEPEARKKREREDAEAIDALRQSATRNVPGAAVLIAAALYFAWQGLREGCIIEIGDKGVLAVDGLISLATSLLIGFSAIRMIWIGPRDKLLLLLVDDFLRKKSSMNAGLLWPHTPPN